jgi:hypothetical protein
MLSDLSGQIITYSQWTAENVYAKESRSFEKLNTKVYIGYKIYSL